MVRGLLGLVFALGIWQTEISTQAQEVKAWIYIAPDVNIDESKFLEVIEVQIRSYHLNIVFDAKTASSKTNIDAGFEKVPHSNLIEFNLRTNRSILSDISPILSYTGETISFAFSDEDFTRELPLAAKLTVFLSAYSVKDCNTVIHLKHEIENSLNEAESKYFNLTAALNFYSGNCEILEGDYQAAVELLKNSLMYESKLTSVASISTLTNLSWLYLQIGQPENALDLMKQMLNQHQTCLEYDFCTFGETRNISAVLVYRAQLYALAFRYDDAIADMDFAIEIDPHNPELYVLRGQMILLLYEWDRVLADYNRAIELDPEYANAYYYRGILFYTQGPRENAITDFQRYLELAPAGEHAADATQYIEDIQRELEVLND